MFLGTIKMGLPARGMMQYLGRVKFCQTGLSNPVKYLKLSSLVISRASSRSAVIASCVR